MKQTQHEKIIEFMSDGLWHCQTQFWQNYIFSPHKRRAEIEELKDEDGNKKYLFEERSCEHGVNKSKDFRLVKLGNTPVVLRPVNYVPTSLTPKQETLL